MYWEFELILFVFLLLVGLVALEVKDLLVSVVMLSAFSFTMALMFTSMGAVDVGFTEAVVGAGVTGILFLIALYQTTQKSKD